MLGNAAAPGLVAAWRIGEDAWRRRLHRGELVIDMAPESLGNTPQQLVDLVGDDPARIELAGRVLEAAGRAKMADKIRALRRVLANGLGDDTKVDEALVLTNALAEWKHHTYECWRLWHCLDLAGRWHR